MVCVSVYLLYISGESFSIAYETKLKIVLKKELYKYQLPNDRTNSEDTFFLVRVCVCVCRILEVNKENMSATLYFDFSFAVSFSSTFFSVLFLFCGVFFTLSLPVSLSRDAILLFLFLFLLLLDWHFWFSPSLLLLLSLWVKVFENPCPNFWFQITLSHISFTLSCCRRLVFVLHLFNMKK